MAGTYHFQLYQRTTVDLLLTWKDSAGDPIDLTGWSAAMQVRTEPRGTVLADLSSGNGKITLGGAVGTIRLLVAATETAGWTWSRGRYDLLLTNPAGQRTRLLQGMATLSEGITE